MRYAMLICVDEKWMASLDDTEEAAILAGYGQFMEEMNERGVLLGGERLRPTSDATSVRVRSGETLTTDGPYAETKEQLAGYYMVDCKDLDEAIAVAAQIPGARMGTVEVRPIWET